MSEIKTVNPFTEEVLETYKSESLEDIQRKVSSIRDAQAEWKKDIEERLNYFKKTLKPNFERNQEELAKLMTSEMGKPISQSRAEGKKSISLIDYLIGNSKNFLENEQIGTEAMDSHVRFDPLGVIMSIEPWNFPSWQVVRAVMPALMSGNGVILKHASQVSGTSLKLKEIFDTPLFDSTITRGETATSAIKYVDGIAFTGSTEVGQKIAAEAGKELKKVVMELGGSDPFIVMKSADLDYAAKNATFGRLQNNGQSCIASKRFIVQEEVYNEFYEKLKDEFSKVRIGDPMDSGTFLGPLSSSSQRSTVLKQVDDLSGTSEIEYLGEKSGNIVPPTLIRTDVSYQDEIFGPVAIVKKFRKDSEAVRMANETPYGLGSSVWADPDDARGIIPDINAGMVFVNKVVSSDPRLPFGGVKKSGLGRELSRYGLLEFTNIKTVWIDGKSGN